METPNNKIKASVGEYTISQSETNWRRHLVLVSSLPNRFVGIVDDPHYHPGRPFTIYGTMLYVAELMFAPVTKMMEGPNGEKIPVRGPDGRPEIIGLHGSTKLHTLVPYDFLGTPEIEIVSAQHVMWVTNQPEEIKKWMYEQYLHYFDPPRIVRV